MKDDNPAIGFISTALFANTPVLYSEDMQDGFVLEEGLRILNPLNLM